MSTPKNILGALGSVNEGVTLAIELAGVLVPLAKGTVQEIRQVITGGKSVTYQVLVQTDNAELDAIDKISADDLAAVNAELAKLGLPALPVPGAPPITQ